MKNLLLAAAMTLAITAEAKAFSARDLVADCEGANEQFCLGFIQGAENDHRSFVLLLKGHPAICFPEGTTLEQLKAPLVSYLKSHPEDLGGPADIVLMLSLRELYPCAKSVQTKKIKRNPTIPIRDPRGFH